MTGGIGPDACIDAVGNDAPKMYKTFRDKKGGCVKVVLKPGR